MLKELGEVGPLVLEEALANVRADSARVCAEAFPICV